MKVRKLYEKIEVETEEDYEFLTEDCMRDLGWSECLATKSCMPVHDNCLAILSVLSCSSKGADCGSESTLLEDQRLHQDT